MSKGQKELEKIINDLFPYKLLVKEYHIGEKLRIDLYIPQYQIAFEYHGRQHFEYVEHFHKDIYGFHDSLKRDQRKAELCEQRGIVLLVFRYDEKLTHEFVNNRVKDALINGEIPNKPQKTKKSWGKIDKNSEYYKKQKELQKQYRKENYQRMKELKKRIDGR